MKKLQDIDKWKHDHSTNEWTSLYADTAPKQRSLSPFFHDGADSEFSIADQTTAGYAHKNLGEKNQEKNQFNELCE